MINASCVCHISVCVYGYLDVCVHGAASGDTAIQLTSLHVLTPFFHSTLYVCSVISVLAGNASSYLFLLQMVSPVNEEEIVYLSSCVCVCVCVYE